MKEKNGDSMLLNSFTREKRARMRVCAIFDKMLRIALNVCKIILRRF